MQEYKVTVFNNRTEWRDLKTLKRHRLDGPAIKYADGSKEWWVEGQLHRIDGPAVEYADGSKEWWVEGQLHRLDGPAYEGANGYKSWYIEDKLHRLDGPAVEHVDGYKAWWIEGKHMTEEEFNEYIQKLNKPADPCNNKVVEIEGRKYRLTAID